MKITINNLELVYRRRRRMIPVLRNFSYEFISGKLYLIRGESGKGKTTLLSLLGLLQKETAGEILFDNECVSRLSNERKCEIRRERIGFVFQDYNLINNLTALDNIVLVDVCEGRMSKRDAYAKAEEILSSLQLEHRMQHYPNEMSGGEQQRVGIARAIFKDPDLIICDEPISNLDESNCERILTLLNLYAHEHNKCVIVTSHNHLFDQYADEVIKL